MKNNYRQLTLTSQDVEQLSNQVLTIVGPNGQQAIRREWERVQLKTHQIQTAILRVTFLPPSDLQLPLLSLEFRSNNNCKIVSLTGLPLLKKANNYPPN